MLKYRKKCDLSGQSTPTSKRRIMTVETGETGSEKGLTLEGFSFEDGYTVRRNSRERSVGSGLFVSKLTINHISPFSLLRYLGALRVSSSSSFAIIRG